MSTNCSSLERHSQSNTTRQSCNHSRERIAGNASHESGRLRRAARSRGWACGESRSSRQHRRDHLPAHGFESMPSRRERYRELNFWRDPSARSANCSQTVFESQHTSTVSAAGGMSMGRMPSSSRNLASYESGGPSMSGQKKRLSLR